MTAISDLYDSLRHVLGDTNTNAQKYSDAALLTGIKTIVKMGRASGYTLTTDQLSITPTLDDPNAFALILLYSAMSFIIPGSSAWSFRTRAVSKSFSNKNVYCYSMWEQINELENGTMFTTWQSFYSWSQAQIGLPLGLHLTSIGGVTEVGSVTIG